MQAVVSSSAISPGLFASWGSFSTFINSQHEHLSCSLVFPGQLAGEQGLPVPPQPCGMDTGALCRQRDPSGSPVCAGCAAATATVCRMGLGVEPCTEAMHRFLAMHFARRRWWGVEKKKKMQLHTFLGLSGTEEPSLKGPRAGGCPAPQLSAQILSITRATAGTGAVGSSSPGGPGRQGRGSGSLGPSLGDLWGKVVDRKPLRPGNRQHPTAADAEHCASEHSCGVQVGAAARSRSYR